jgi:hypothetical protein
MRRSGGEDGSAVVEFCLMSVLLVLLLFGVLQVAAVYYVRSVVSSAASDGARYAANADVDPAAGGGRAGDLIGHGLGSRMAARLPCTGHATRDAASGLVAAEVRCQGRISSLFVPVGPLVRIDVSARSLKDPP